MADNWDDLEGVVIDYVSNRDIEKIFKLRNELYEQNAMSLYIQNTNYINAALKSALNDWLNEENMVIDVEKTKLTMLFTISWIDVSRIVEYYERTLVGINNNKRNMRYMIYRIFSQNLNRELAYRPGTLWDFIREKQTVSQIGSNISLDDWSEGTRTAVFNNADEIARTFRG